MATRRKRTPPIDGPEFIVSRDFFDRYFENGLPPSTFYDRVEEGKILPWPAMKGKFFLNASLQRMGLPTEKELPKAVPGRSLEDVCRLAFTLIDPVLFPAPPWLLKVEAIDSVVADHAERLADQYRDKLATLKTPEEKLAYFGGALDAQVLIEADNES